MLLDARLVNQRPMTSVATMKKTTMTQSTRTTTEVPGRRLRGGAWDGNTQSGREGRVSRLLMRVLTGFRPRPQAASLELPGIPRGLRSRLGLALCLVALREAAGVREEVVMRVGNAPV